MFLALQRLCGVVVIGVCLTGPARPMVSAAEPAINSGAPALDPEGEALKGRVIAGIRRNYAKIPSVRCRQVLTSIDARAKKREVVRGTTNEGALFEGIVAPKTTTETELILVGGNMRADSLNPETQEKWSVSMHDDVWTNFHPERDFARKKYRDQLGGEMNLDPRNIGAWEQKTKFLKELQRYRVARHESIERGGDRLQVLWLSEFFPQANITVTTRFEFDPARNYLPVRIVGGASESGVINWVHDVEYQEVVPKAAWFLKTSRIRFFADKPPKTADAEGWTQQMTTEIVGPVRIHETFAESAFDIDIPAGTNYIDQTIGRERPVE